MWATTRRVDPLSDNVRYRDTRSRPMAQEIAPYIIATKTMKLLVSWLLYSFFLFNPTWLLEWNSTPAWMMVSAFHLPIPIRSIDPRSSRHAQEECRPSTMLCIPRHTSRLTLCSSTVSDTTEYLEDRASTTTTSVAVPSTRAPVYPTPPSFTSRAQFFSELCMALGTFLLGFFSFTSSLWASPPHHNILAEPPPGSMLETLLEMNPMAVNVGDVDTTGSIGPKKMQEVWELVRDNFYDRSFNGQDWNALREKYMEAAESISKMQIAGYLDVEYGYTMIDDSIGEMLETLGDPYTRLVDQDDIMLSQSYDVLGIGVELAPGTSPRNPHADEESKRMMVLAEDPMAGSPAQELELEQGDVVMGVNGHSVEGKTMMDVVELVSTKDPNQQDLVLSLRRERKTNPDDPNKQKFVYFDVTVPRRQYVNHWNPTWYRVSEHRPDGTVVGYIRVPEFTAETEQSVHHALEELKKQGSNAYVLDLRGNPGGSMESALQVASLFVDHGVAMYVKDPASGVLNDTYWTFHGQTEVDAKTPLVIWMDKNTASASELLAATLHDNCRAVTMGDQSFGKGVIQELHPLSTGGGLVLTEAEYRTPRGKAVHHVGLTPDIPQHIRFPQYVPFLGSDTSQIDFQDVQRRLASGSIPAVQQSSQVFVTPSPSETHV
eukprot:Nitzschia sp. Nitz4//scaffold44_size153857//65093//67200//NITZ4_002719-RA/size153857-augustus-gene-0.6-mRNA-1//1//CDS//3329552151//8427//frame0